MFHKLKDAAIQLHVSERFLRQLVAQGHLPFYRLSPRTLRVDLNELREHMRMIAEGKATSHEGRDDE